jgi:hypothetical protein
MGRQRQGAIVLTNKTRKTMAEKVLNYPPLAPAIGPASPDDRRRARAAGGPPRRPSISAGETGSEPRSHPAFECIALLLQGGGALGAYQAGVYEALTEAGHIQRLRWAMADLLDKLPEDLRNGPEAQLLRPVGDHKAYNIIHLIYRVRNYEGHSKDYDFSRASMQEQWRAGYYDTIRTLRHPEVLERPANHEGVFTFDLSQDGRE